MTNWSDTDVEALKVSKNVSLEEHEDPRQTLPTKLPFKARRGKPPTRWQLCVSGIVLHRRYLVLFLWPVICATVFFGGTGIEWKCLYVALLMSGYWVSRSMPLAVTGLIPVALFPLLGILDTKATCSEYFSDTSAMFLTALFLAFAAEATNLHTRIALKVVGIIGRTPLRLLLGMMASTAFISMWVVNTAATALMSPIALEIIKELEEERLIQAFEPAEGDEPPYPSRITRCYLFGIAYAASIGGIGTVVGSGTNIAFKGTFETKFPYGPKVEFAKWMAVMVPMVVILVIGVWFILSFQFLGLFRKSEVKDLPYVEKIRSEDKKRKSMRVVQESVGDKRSKLGPMRWAEIVVLTMFIVAITLWILRLPSWAPGWADYEPNIDKGDATPSTILCILLFMIPSSTSIFYCVSWDPRKRPSKAVPSILTWGYVKVKMIWGVILLIGGGYALAKGFEESGLTKMLGQATKGMKVLPPFVILMISCFVAKNLTELTANVAVAHITLAIVSEMAVVLEINPLYLMIPVTLCCSFAFMTPVGSPTNAVIARMGNIRYKDMIITGIAPSVLSYLVVILIFPTWGSIIYDLSYSNWATMRRRAEIQ